jgi:type I restriction enzyme S subunit
MKMLAVSLIAGPFGSSIRKDMYVHDGYRVYGQEQVIPDDFSIGDYFITSDKFREMERYSVSPGDVLISCVGSFGKIAVVPINIHPGIINPRLLRLRPKKSRVISEYLGTVLRSYVGFTQMEQEGRGGTMDVINIGLLGQLRLPLPPKNEQAAILEFITDQNGKINNLHSAYSRQLTLLAEYRAALIHECVTGVRSIPDHFNPGVYEND